MSEHRDLNTGDILPAGFLDALQEYLGIGVFNFRLDKATADPATAVKVTTGDGSTPGTGNDQVSIAIMGQWRYRRTAVSGAAPGGLSVGTHNVFVTAPALNTAQEDAGTFNYDFGVELRAASGGNPTTAVWRKVGTFDWDGTKITGVAQTVGIYTSAQGVAGGELTGTYPNPTIGQLAAGRVLTWGGDTNLYRSAPALLKTDGTFAAVGSLYAALGAAGQVSLFNNAGVATVAFGSAGAESIYRSGAGALRTNASLTVDGGITVSRAGALAANTIQNSGNTSHRVLASTGIHEWADGAGGALDTNLYRSAAATLKTDGAFVVGGALSVLGAASVTGVLTANTIRDGSAVDYVHGLDTRLPRIIANDMKIRDVGEIGQIRAGRSTSVAADWSNINVLLVGLYNLSDTQDASGNAFHLSHGKTATVTIASPAVVSLNNHGLVAGDRIVFSTTGALPTGLTAGTVYYVIATGLTSSAFQLSTAPAGGAVNTSGSQSGVHTLKGGIFGSGITGAATEAYIGFGNPITPLYITSTTNAAAELQTRIKTGAMGAWFRTGKRGVQQSIISRGGAGVFAYQLDVNASNQLQGYGSFDGTTTGFQFAGITDVCDDRWHYGVLTFDGSRARLYVDGVLEASLTATGTLSAAAAQTFNIGGRAGDGTVAATIPFFGRIDDAFLTSDVPTEEGIRYLYAASIPYGATVAGANSAALTLYRGNRGNVLTTSDFPVAGSVSRLYNFSQTALTDAGANNTPVTQAGGTMHSVAGPHGGSFEAFQLSGSGNYQATDIGMPSGLNARSYGVWFRAVTLSASNQYFMGWGVSATNDARMGFDTTGKLISLSSGDTITSGAFVVDGLWHHAVTVEDNTAIDGLKRKLYLDGRLVGTSTTLNSISLGGANNFRLFASAGSVLGMVAGGALSRAFVYAGALTPEQVHAVYNANATATSQQTKSSAEHVEYLENDRALVIFDAVNGIDLVTLEVAA